MPEKVIKLYPVSEDISPAVAALIKFHTISRTGDTISIGDFASKTEITVKKSDIPLLIAILGSHLPEGSRP
jgi:hypothetical protein